MKQSPGEIRDSLPPADVYEIKPPGEEPEITKCGDGGENVGILSLHLGREATGTVERADLAIVMSTPLTPSASAASGSGLKTAAPCLYLAATLCWNRLKPDSQTTGLVSSAASLLPETR